MTHWKIVAFSSAWVVLISPGHAAGLITPPDLPPTGLARQAIEQDPRVAEARSILGASRHGAAALRAGPHEWAARLSAQRRSYDTGLAAQQNSNGTGSRSNEWVASLERPIRINGKAELDAQLGEAELRIAQARIGEARHEAARALAKLWLNALAASRLRNLLVEQLGFAQNNQKAAQRRRRAGDASKLQVNLATADLAEVQRQLSAATTAEARARATLRIRFPQLPMEAKALSAPVPPGRTLEQWRARILAESDPIRLVEAQLRKAELAASRARADRVPDPTVGVYAASEANRNERIFGVTVSIPLSGTYRNERMLQALREVEAAQVRLDSQRREIDAEITAAYIDAVGSYERWRLASQGLAATRDNARLTQRAYTLGEVDLQGLLLARRQALDAAMAAEQAQAEALGLHHQLLIDAHLVWELDED